jgi:transcriptional regulator with XRE-family HTH domain
MLVGERLRELREAQHLSQGDIQNRTGLMRSYISRVENGHTVPAIETLEKISRALGVPTYQIFYDGAGPLPPPPAPSGKQNQWGASGRSARYLHKLRRMLARMNADDRNLVLFMAKKISHR